MGKIAVDIGMMTSLLDVRASARGGLANEAPATRVAPAPGALFYTDRDSA